MLVRIAHHPRYTRQRCQLVRRPLSIAARHQNAAIRIHPLQSPYRCARILIRALGYRAGIQHHNFRVASRLGALQPAFQKLPLQRGPIGLRSTAAKILYVEASHVPIVNDWMRLKLSRSPRKDATSACRSATASGKWKIAGLRKVGRSAPSASGGSPADTQRWQESPPGRTPPSKAQEDIRHIG